VKTAATCEECVVTTTQLTVRLVVSLCLALLAASIPQVRVTILDQIGALDLLPKDASAGGPNPAARAFD
jgi:hypothetical protein